MAGSEAEERIRAKAEARLRALFPEARIIHELVLEQGGVRIDIAAVTPDRLVAVEIKSERDNLKRLSDQVAVMRRVCDAYIVVVAGKWVEQARRIAGYFETVSEDDIDDPHPIWGTAGAARRALEGVCRSPDRLEMLWADELRFIASIGGKATRGACIRAISDTRTGAEVRRAVCAALRGRSFPRADPAIPVSGLK